MRSRAPVPSPTPAIVVTLIESVDITFYYLQWNRTGVMHLERFKLSTYDARAAVGRDTDYTLHITVGSTGPRRK